ncbi:hypothetical protein [Bacillus sp. PK3_68]|uniref:hypothetical protein n=1 Tax=Bacillus sp. PK3_68 TaxID=2027408 RepID=UPI000E70C7F0|nr:hypothetical protein [Bacillus sp. PK3_68]RJS61329.1 hypothetical protein CJ483_15825 [Bacillus sp. PK3_68]
MKKKYALCSIVTTLLLGACTGMNKADKNINRTIDKEVAIQADGERSAHPAVQDYYTRTFLVSDREAEKGFYEMRTWTDAYSILIPAEATLDETYYMKRGQSWEQFLFSWIDEETNISYGVQGQFEDGSSEESGLRRLTRYMNFKDEYEKSEDDHHIYYYGKLITEVGGKDGKEKVPVYSYLGFIKDKGSSKTLSLIYEHNCSDWTNTCEADTKEIEEHFWHLVKTVKFDDWFCYGKGNGVRKKF